MLFFSIKDDGENISEYDAKKTDQIGKEMPFLDKNKYRAWVRKN